MKELCVSVFHRLVPFDVSATLCRCVNPSTDSKKRCLCMMSKVSDGGVKENLKAMDTVTNANSVLPPFSFLLSFFVRGEPLPSRPVSAAAVSDESGVQMQRT